MSILNKIALRQNLMVSSRQLWNEASVGLLHCMLLPALLVWVLKCKHCWRSPALTVLLYELPFRSELSMIMRLICAPRDSARITIHLMILSRRANYATLVPLILHW